MCYRMGGSVGEPTPSSPLGRSPGGCSVFDMRRREFITLLGGRAASPCAARAQQPVVPVVATPICLRRAPTLLRHSEGLSERGYVERNVTIGYALAHDDCQVRSSVGPPTRLKSKQVSAIIGNPHPPSRGGSSWPAKEKTDGTGESFCEVPLWPGRLSFLV